MKKSSSTNTRYCFAQRMVTMALFFLFCLSAASQHTENHDSTMAPPAGEESTVDSASADTSSDKFNYFESTRDLSFDTIHLREIPQRLVDSFKKDDAFWYADKSFKRKPRKEQKDEQEEETESPGKTGRWMNMITLVILVVVFMGILGWYLFQQNIIRQKKSVAGANLEEGFDEGNIFDINYEREISVAISSNNYRLAIRLLFLQLLKRLSQEKIIEFKQGRTNLDYLAQLSPGRYYHDFFRVARNYEYAWYGKFEVSPQSFEVIKQDFENFNRSIS